MIEIIYRRKEHSLTVQGHAGSDTYGKDLVCAGVSALVLAWQENLNQLQENGCLQYCWQTVKPGLAQFSCTPKKSFQRVVLLMEDTLFSGFVALAKKYRKYIKFKVI